MDNQDYVPQGGYYGKVPSHGDFVEHKLPKRFTRAWDQWLQLALSSSKKQLGDIWLDRYLTTPMYRYVLSNGICGDDCWIGVMMPSVDRVGRYFPMTISQAFPRSYVPVVLMEKMAGWFDAAEALLLSCLDDDFSLSFFREKVDELIEDTSDHYPEKIPDNIDLAGNDSAVRYRGEQSCLAYQLCSHPLMNKFFVSYSLWQSHGGCTDESILLLAEGLPEYENFSVMLGQEEQ